jgi:hypothetical protein
VWDNWWARAWGSLWGWGSDSWLVVVWAVEWDQVWAEASWASEWEKLWAHRWEKL